MKLNYFFLKRELSGVFVKGLQAGWGNVSMNDEKDPHSLACHIRFCHLRFLTIKVSVAFTGMQSFHLSCYNVSDVTSCSKVVLQCFCNCFITVNLPFSAFHQLFHWVRGSQNSSWQCLMFSDQLQPLHLLLTWNSWTDHWKCAIAVCMH